MKGALEPRSELAKQPSKDNAELGTVAPRTAGQIDAVKAVVQGSISRESGIAILVQTCRRTEELADEMLGPPRWRRAGSRRARMRAPTR